MSPRVMPPSFVLTVLGDTLRKAREAEAAAKQDSQGAAGTDDGRREEAAQRTAEVERLEAAIEAVTRMEGERAAVEERASKAEADAAAARTERDDAMSARAEMAKSLAAAEQEARQADEDRDQADDARSQAIAARDEALARAAHAEAERDTALEDVRRAQELLSGG